MIINFENQKFYQKQCLKSNVMPLRLLNNIINIENTFNTVYVIQFPQNIFMNKIGYQLLTLN